MRFSEQKQVFYTLLFDSLIFKGKYWRAWCLLVFLTTQKRHSKLKSRSRSLSSSLRGCFPYVELFSLLPNSSITDMVSPVSVYDLLAPWWESDYVSRYFLYTCLSDIAVTLCPHVSYNWCPRVTCTFKWAWLTIIHILSFINTGKDRRKFFTFILPMCVCLNVECHQLISLLPI